MKQHNPDMIILCIHFALSHPTLALVQSEKNLKIPITL